MGIQAVRFPGQSRAVTSSDTRRPFSVYTLMFLFVWKQKKQQKCNKISAWYTYSSWIKEQQNSPWSVAQIDVLNRRGRKSSWNVAPWCFIWVKHVVKWRLVFLQKSAYMCWRVCTFFCTSVVMKPLFPRL